MLAPLQRSKCRRVPLCSIFRLARASAPLDLTSKKELLGAAGPNHKELFYLECGNHAEKTQEHWSGYTDYFKWDNAKSRFDTMARKPEWSSGNSEAYFKQRNRNRNKCWQSPVGLRPREPHCYRPRGVASGGLKIHHRHFCLDVSDQVTADQLPSQRALWAQGLGYWSAGTRSETVQAIFEVVDLILTQSNIFNYIITEKC